MSSFFASFSRPSFLKTAFCLSLLGSVALTDFSSACAETSSSKKDAEAEQVFTAKQRAAIIAIVRNALKKDPSILTDALMNMKQQEEEANNAEVTKNVQKNWASFVKADPQLIWGSKDANKTITAFLDPRCGYCKRMVPVLKDYLKNHPDVRIIERQVPLLGASSEKAVKALFAAQQQGKYKEMRDLVMSAPSIDSAKLLQFAAKLKLDQKRFKADLDSKTVLDEMNQNIRLSQLARMQGTPHFLFGVVPVSGGLSLEEMSQLTKEMPKDPA